MNASSDETVGAISTQLQAAKDSNQDLGFIDLLKVVLQADDSVWHGSECC